MSSSDMISDDEIMEMIGRSDPTTLTPMQSAAPELYTALSDCLEYITSAGDPAVVAKTSTALAKARGETP